MMLSKFINKVENISYKNQSRKVKALVVSLKNLLNQKGDIEINIEGICILFGIEIK